MGRWWTGSLRKYSWQFCDSAGSGRQRYGYKRIAGIDRGWRGL